MAIDYWRFFGGGGGHWVTIETDGEETHIFISAGVVTKGPAHLIGARAGHLPPIPGKRSVTHHPEGHEPAGARDHPAYTEHTPPEKKKGQPYAREHGAAQTRQNQNPEPLTREEAEAGLKKAVEQKRTQRQMGQERKDRENGITKGESTDKGKGKETEQTPNEEAQQAEAEGPMTRAELGRRKDTVAETKSQSAAARAALDAHAALHGDATPKNKAHAKERASLEDAYHSAVEAHMEAHKSYHQARDKFGLPHDDPTVPEGAHGVGYEHVTPEHINAIHGSEEHRLGIVSVRAVGEKRFSVQLPWTDGEGTAKQVAKLVNDVGLIRAQNIKTHIAGGMTPELARAQTDYDLLDRGLQGLVQERDKALDAGRDDDYNHALDQLTRLMPLHLDAMLHLDRVQRTAGNTDPHHLPDYMLGAAAAEHLRKGTRTAVAYDPAHTARASKERRDQRTAYGAQIAARLDKKLPDYYHALHAAHGGKVQLTERDPTAATGRKDGEYGVPNSRVAGLHEYAKRLSWVFDRGRRSQAPTLSSAETHGAVAAHEMGHGLDVAAHRLLTGRTNDRGKTWSQNNTLSHQDDFKAIYDKHKNNEMLWSYMRERPEEMFAEGLANFHGFGAHPAMHLKKHAPELYNYFSELGGKVQDTLRSHTLGHDDDKESAA